ncbi:MAG: ATP synthase F1 subunit epsilon [Lentisphaeria bacterium]
MAETFQLEVLSVDGRILDTQVEYASFTGAEGQLGVYAHHVPLITRLEEGEVTYLVGGASHVLAVGTGVIKITGRSVTVITDMAINADGVDQARIAEARKLALERRHERLSDTESATITSMLAHTLTELRAGRRRGSGSPSSGR